MTTPCNCRRLRAEVRLLRKTLEQIATGKRNTLERRLARSTLEFWEALQAERRKKA